MKQSRKISVIVMSILMVLTMIPLQSFGADLPFTDVPGSEWYYSDVKNAWETGLINGFEDNTFRPDENMTYAQAVKLASCMNQKYTTGSVTLENGSLQWYDSYVAYAKDKSIIGKDYDWNTSATRAGYVEIFANALPDEALKVKNSIADNAIPDVAMTHPQAAAIYKLYRAGILTGMDDQGTFEPNKNIRRSEVSAILTRMMNESARKELTLGSETPDTPDIPEASLLSFEKQPESTAIDEGGSTVLSAAVAGGKEPYKYQWYKDGSVISGATSTTYSATTAGGYVCRVKDGDGKTLDSDTAVVTVKGSLHITKQPVKSKTVREDMDYYATLAIQAEGGTEPYSYQWYLDGKAISGFDAQKNHFNAKASGDYFCVVTDSEGKGAVSDKSQVTFYNKVYIEKQPEGGVLGPGESMVLRVSVGGGEGEGSYFYWWYKDGVKIDNETGWKAEYTATVPGVYKCFVCSTYPDGSGGLIGYGEQYSENAIVVEATGELRITEQPQNIFTAEGDYISAANRRLTVAANSAYVPLSYQWQAQDNGNWVDIADATDATYVPSVNGNYRVLVKDNAGQGILSDVAAVDIKTWPLIILEQPADVPMLKYEWVLSHWSWGRYQEHPVRMAVTGGTGNYRFSLQVRDTQGDSFREVWWCRQQESLLEMPIWTSEHAELPDLKEYFRDQGNGWAFVSTHGLTVNKPGVQYRIVAEEILPDGSDRTPQQVESRVCTVRDITNAKRGETEILNLNLTYDSSTDSLVTYIYGGTAPYTVRWKYRKWRIDGNGLLWYVGFESWELPANENITVQLTDYGAIVTYPGWSQTNTEPHVKVWDANGSEMETSILM